MLVCEGQRDERGKSSALLEEKNMTLSARGDGKRGVELFEKSVLANIFRHPPWISVCRNGRLCGDETDPLMAHPDAQTVPVIAMTAGCDEDVKKCLAAARVAHIAKPINQELLKRFLNFAGSAGYG